METHLLNPTTLLTGPTWGGSHNWRNTTTTHPSVRIIPLIVLFLSKLFLCLPKIKCGFMLFLFFKVCIGEVLSLEIYSSLIWSWWCHTQANGFFKWMFLNRGSNRDCRGGGLLDHGYVHIFQMVFSFLILKRCYSFDRGASWMKTV